MFLEMLVALQAEQIVILTRRFEQGTPKIFINDMKEGP